VPATAPTCILWLTNCGRQLQAEYEGSVPPNRPVWETVLIRRLIDIPHDVRGGDFPSEHSYATAALAVTLIGVGTAVFIPAMTVGMLGIIGFGSGGVAAGQYFSPSRESPPPYANAGSVAACLQSAIYGGATGGLFSVFQALGATMVAPSLFATFAGFGTAAAGTWIGLTNSMREDPPAAES
jgi:hypothetical protein